VVVTVVTPSALVVVEEEAAVESVLVLASVVVEVLETVLTHVEKVMVLLEDKVHINHLVQVLHQASYQKQMLAMVVL
tara:strand:- start:93 stop:323 length:231 start_codon:yes stop_codon:yes gene_type:complete